MPYGGAEPPGGWHSPPPAAVPVIAPLAGWWSRVGAAVIDGLLLSLPALAVSFAFAFLFIIPLTLTGSDGGAGDVLLILLLSFGYILAVIVVYLATAVLYTGFTMRRAGPHNGQTLGKQALGIRVVRMSGEPQTFWSAAVREVAVKLLLFAGAGSMLFGVPSLLDVLWPLWDDQRRALHDMLVDTRVVEV